MFDTKLIANHFLDLARQDGEQLTQMKLQKLVYYAHGWHLGLTGGPLLNEAVQAWSFGPVLYSLYDEFRAFGSDPINCKAVNDWDGQIPTLNDITDAVERENVRQLLDRVWEVYKGYTATQLSNMTHATGTPWDRVCQEYRNCIPRFMIIPDEYIREHFEREAAG